MTGLQLLQHLHHQGFTRLYLFSGWPFAAGEVPDYVTVIVKDGNTDNILKVL